MRISYDTKLEEWFDDLLIYSMTAKEVARFNETCWKTMDRIFHIAVRSMQNRKKDNTSFDFDF